MITAWARLVGMAVTLFLAFALFGPLATVGTFAALVVWASVKSEDNF